jgi:hypothetical protein
MGLIMDDQLVSFLRSLLDGVEEDELLEDDEEERRLFDFPLCFFTFLNYASFTFSSSRWRRTMMRRKTTILICSFFFAF